MNERKISHISYISQNTVPCKFGVSVGAPHSAQNSKGKLLNREQNNFDTYEKSTTISGVQGLIIARMRCRWKLMPEKRTRDLPFLCSKVVFSANIVLLRLAALFPTLSRLLIAGIGNPSFSLTHVSGQTHPHRFNCNHNEVIFYT